MLISCNKEPIIGENQKTKFVKFFGSSGYDEGNDVIQTQTGNYVFVGTSTTVDKRKDIIVAKTDAYGNTLWTKYFGGVNNDYGNSIILLPNNEYAILGTQTTDSLTTNIVFLKLSSAGKVQLNKIFEFQNNQEGNSLVLSDANQLILAGTTTQSYLQNAEGSKDVFCVKYNYANDSVIWKYQYGSNGDDDCSNIKAIGDGSYIIIGTSNSYLESTNKMFVFQLYGNGGSDDVFTYGDRFHQTIGNKVCVLENGFLFVGTAINPDGDKQVYLVKTGSDIGTVIIDTTYGKKGVDEGKDILNIDNSIYLLSTTTQVSNTDIEIKHLDMFGVSQDTSSVMSFGGTTNESASSFIETNDGGFVIIGTTNFENNSMINLLKIGNLHELIE